MASTRPVRLYTNECILESDEPCVFVAAGGELFEQYFSCVHNVALAHFRPMRRMKQHPYRIANSGNEKMLIFRRSWHIINGT